MPSPMPIEDILSMVDIVTMLCMLALTLIVEESSSEMGSSASTHFERLNESMTYRYSQWSARPGIQRYSGAEVW